MWDFTLNLGTFSQQACSCLHLVVFCVPRAYLCSRSQASLNQASRVDMPTVLEICKLPWSARPWERGLSFLRGRLNF